MCSTLQFENFGVESGLVYELLCSSVWLKILIEDLIWCDLHSGIKCGVQWVSLYSS
jgi:hypothetical protein